MSLHGPSSRVRMSPLPLALSFEAFRPDFRSTRRLMSVAAARLWAPRQPPRTSRSRPRAASCARVQLGDEVIGVAAVPTLRGLNHAAVVEEPAAFDIKSRRAGLYAERLRSFPVDQHCAQTLKRAGRPVPRGMKRS